jgi:hypothetical protein
MNQNEALKTRSMQIRNLTFFVLLASFVSQDLNLLGITGFFLENLGLFSIARTGLGLAVVLLTIRLKESIMRKCCFIAAGGAGAGLAIQNIMLTLGWHTRPMNRLCQPLFLIGAVGSIVCLVRGSMAKDTIMFRKVIKWGVIGTIVGHTPGALALLDYTATSTGRDWGPIAAQFLLVTLTPLGALIGVIGGAIYERSVRKSG